MHMHAYRLTGTKSPRLTLAEVAVPKPGPGDVVVEIGAASLNYRDLLVADGATSIPLSDGAGTIVEIGAAVTTRQVGERVAIGFMPGWVDGVFSAAKQATALGGAEVDGVLAERIVVAASAVVPIPDAMSFAAAATLPCAAVTAWNALFEGRPLLLGETVLLLGTGGVSMFALQFAKAAGARVIVTSSSDAKLERAKALGADVLVNYRRSPSWSEDVLRATEGLGADLAVDVGGPATLNETLLAVRHDGRISLMGVLTGFSGEIDTSEILSKRITLQGIYVGSVATLATVVRSGVVPIIDKRFAFGDAEAAYDALEGAGHVGKLVIDVRN